MSPLSPSRSNRETLGVALMQLRGRSVRDRGVSASPDFRTRAQERAAQLGVDAALVYGAVYEFDRDADTVQRMSRAKHALCRRGFGAQEADALLEKSALAPRTGRMGLGGTPPEVVERVMRRVFGQPLQVRAQEIYERRFEDAFPGTRRIRYSSCDEGVSVSFEGREEWTGGSIEVKKQDIGEKGRKRKRVYALRCSLSVAADCAERIFKPGILGNKRAVTVWADEIKSPMLPRGTRAFAATWVEGRRGYRVARRTGIIIKTVRGALEHYPGGTLEGVMQARQISELERAEERSKVPRPFRLSKARKTLAKKMEGAKVTSPAVELFALKF